MPEPTADVGLRYQIDGLCQRMVEFGTRARLCPAQVRLDL